MSLGKQPKTTAVQLSMSRPAGENNGQFSCRSRGRPAWQINRRKIAVWPSSVSGRNVWCVCGGGGVVPLSTGR